MRSLLKVSAVIVVAMSLTGSAVAAKCEPIEEGDIEGHIELAWPADQSLSASYFLENSCDWGDGEDLNGFDAVVLDVESVGGTTGSLTASASGVVAIGIKSQFLDADCSTVSEVPRQSATGDAYSLEIPADAKWMLVVPASTNYVSRDVTVTLHSDGKDCSKKKKGKKKVRHRGL